MLFDHRSTLSPIEKGTNSCPERINSVEPALAQIGLFRELNPVGSEPQPRLLILCSHRICCLSATFFSFGSKPFGVFSAHGVSANNASCIVLAGDQPIDREQASFDYNEGSQTAEPPEEDDGEGSEHKRAESVREHLGDTLPSGLVRCEVGQWDLLEGLRAARAAHVHSLQSTENQRPIPLIVFTGYSFEPF
ncbi:hypothetical protein [Bradyrhizobium tunisiense]|uniref:hypothetical protein n=1 Tax=Bradyrhizobium tunisiense TaxID=3278709 RepID=UPI0035D6F76B